MKKIALDCQKCGGILEISEDMEMFKCKYCDTPYMVERSGDVTRIVRLEQRVSEIEKKHGQLDSGVAKLEVKALEEEKEIALDKLVEKNNPLSNILGGVAVAGAVGFICSRQLDLNDFWGPLICFGFPLAVGALLIYTLWIPYLNRAKRIESDYEEKIEGARKRMNKQ